MMAMTLDTHKAIQRLISKGFSAEQAEGVVNTIMEVDSSSLVTKADLSEFKAEIYKFIMLNTAATIGIIVTLKLI